MNCNNRSIDDVRECFKSPVENALRGCQFGVKLFWIGFWTLEIGFWP